VRLSGLLVEYRYARTPARGATAVDVTEGGDEVLVWRLEFLQNGGLAEKAALSTRHFADASWAERKQAADMGQCEPN